jgi:drug/metabolite transporter (DMT)-like permease
MMAYVLPFLIAFGSVAVFSLFAFLATLYREHRSSRLLMWVGLLAILGGCWLFGMNVISLSKLWIIITSLFFAVLFGLSAGYFIRRSRKAKR